MMNPNLLERLPFARNRVINKFSDMNSLPSLSLGNNENNSSTHSGSGLLGPAWQENNPQILKILKELISKRPNKSCYIASQQLGGLTHLNDLDTIFHRDAIKRINGAWKAYDQSKEKKPLNG